MDENPSHHRDMSGANNPMFGKPGCAGDKNGNYGKRRELAPTWKGGRKIRRDGYVLAVAPDDHPNPADYFPDSGLKYVLEHRLMMECRCTFFRQKSFIIAMAILAITHWKTLSYLNPNRPT